MTKGKLILAYSGCLDTSVILHWLIAKGYNPKDAIGFIKVNAIRLINNALRQQRMKQ